MSTTTTAIDDLRHLYAQLQGTNADIPAIVTNARKIVDDLLRDGTLTETTVFDDISGFPPFEKCSNDEKERYESLVEEILEDLIDVCVIESEGADRNGSMLAKDYFASRRERRTKP